MIRRARGQPERGNETVRADRCANAAEAYRTRAVGKPLFALTAYCTIYTILYRRFAEEDVAVAEAYGVDIAQIAVARSRGVPGCVR